MSFDKLRLSDPSSITSGASASSSSIQKRFKYDVFISFRGEDTRKNFVDHLYQALKDKGIYTYKDDEKIQKGKRISDDLFQSIENSKFYIIIFSKNYASSSWCLEELVRIMECHKMPGHTAYPVFYDVEPTEVRNQSGAVKKAFSKNKNKEAAEKWRKALKEAADLAGWELKNTLDGHEAKFKQKIVQEISLELRSINFGFVEKLVGMETRVKDVVSSLEVGIDEVLMIGIKAMGGAGKTTTTRAVFDHLSADFEAISFVENVREVTNASMFGLKKLQEQVLSKVLNEHVTLDSVTDGKNMMKRRMCGIKVLLVLDDVDHIDQLEALAEPNWFKPGSRIIITTRDEQVLVAHRVNLIQDIDLLSDKEAICLFSRYAFGRELPSQGYEELSGKVVRYAAGLPLTVKVLGSFLSGKDKLEWVDAIDRLEKIPLKETLKQLELSYVSLEDDCKEIFLDIACILKGERREYAIRVLECCGFHARIGLKVLEQRCLITISKDEDEFLGMHDHIEEMGKNIVRREHPDEPDKHSRLWIKKEIKDILANEMGTDETRCLKLYMPSVNARTVMKSLGKMKKLRYLEVHFDRYGNLASDGEELDIPNSLKYLKCERYPFLYLPKTFQASNLVGLDMDDSRRMVQLWEEGEKKVLKKLKFLSLKGSNLTTFDFRITPNLETLSLINSSLKELCMPASCQKLKHLHINCSDLRSFDLGLTPNLETLSLTRCFNLVELCMPASCQKLKHLHIYWSDLRSFDLGLTPNLETLSLTHFFNLVELCMPASCQKLKHLHIRGLDLRSFDLVLTPNLETLTLIDSSNLKEICMPANCQNLESLDIRGCRKLVEINAPVGCLKKVVRLNLTCCELLEKLPEDIGGSECLEELDITDMECSRRMVQKKVLNKLKSLSLCGSNLTIFDLRITPNLEALYLSHSLNLKELCMPASCQKLNLLEISGTKLRTFDLGLTPNLETLRLIGCADFVELHMSVACPNLKIIFITLSGLRSLDLELIPNLESLDVTGCHELVEIECPKNVVKLNLSGCELLEKLGCPKKVVHLNLSGCELLEKLPEDIGRSKCLKELDITYTGISHLPQSIFELKGLIIAACQWLLELYDFPSEIKITTSTLDEWYQEICTYR